MGKQSQSVRQTFKPIKNKQMNTEIKTDFDKLTFQAKREFNAPVSLVWLAYTKKDCLTNGGLPNHGSEKQRVWISDPKTNGLMIW